MLHQANAETLTPFSKERTILYECKGCNARQFITEFPDKGWTKNSIDVKRKFGTLDMLTRQCSVTRNFHAI